MSFAVKSKKYIKINHELNSQRIAALNSIFTYVKEGQ